jgi:hypothetical protein
MAHDLEIESELAKVQAVMRLEGHRTSTSDLLVALASPLAIRPRYLPPMEKEMVQRVMAKALFHAEEKHSVELTHLAASFLHQQPLDNTARQTCP